MLAFRYLNGRAVEPRDLTGRLGNTGFVSFEIDNTGEMLAVGYLDGAIYRLRGVEISYRAARQRPIHAVRLRRTIALFAASLTLLGIAAPVIAADEEWEFQGVAGDTG